MKSKAKAPKTKHIPSTLSSTATTPPQPPSEPPSDVLKLGRVVTIADRLRWIRIPKKGNKKKNPKQSFEYWPGIIYKSYSELMQDVKSRNNCSTKLLTQCFMRRQKQQRHSRENLTSKLSSLVGVVCFGDSYGLREFEDCALTHCIIQELNDPNTPNMDDTGDTRIQPFYPHYEEHYNFGIEHNSGTFDNEKQGSFDDAIQTVLSLLGEQEDEDEDSPIFVINEEFYRGLDSVETSNTLVSPDGFVREKNTGGLVEVATVTVNRNKKTKVISRSTEEEYCDEDNTSAGDSHFGDDVDQKNEDDEIVYDNDECHHDVSGRTGHTKTKKGSGGNAHLTKSPDQTESDSSSVSEISLIKPDDPWKVVWEKMKGMGWIWVWRKNDRSYIFGKDGKEYLSQEEIEELAEREYGWIKPRPLQQGRRRKRTETFISKIEPKRQKAKEEKKALTKKRENDLTKKKGKGGKKNGKKKSSSKRSWGQTSYLSPSRGSGDLNFTYVWKYLKDKGWTHVKPHDPLHDWYYLKPGIRRGKKSIHGIEGEDYFLSSNHLLEYLQRNDHLLGSPSTSFTESESGMETTPTCEKYPSDYSADNSSNSGSQSSVGNNMHGTSDDKLDKSLELGGSLDTCSNDQDERHWWLSSTIPHFSSEVWPLLKNITPYRNGYVVQRNGKTHKMSSVKEMQTFLSIHGLELSGRHGLDENDLETLSRWISLAQLPGKMSGKSLRAENSLTMLCNVPILDSAQAWSILCTYYNCQETDDGKFFAPTVGHDPFFLIEEDETFTFDSIEKLRTSIRCYGLKSKRREDEILVSLILWASLSEVDPFVFVPSEPQNKGEESVERPMSQYDDGNTEKLDIEDTSSAKKERDPTISIPISDTINKSKVQDDGLGAGDIEGAINSAESENDQTYYDNEYFNQEERKEGMGSESLLTQDVMDCMNSNEILDTVLPFQSLSKKRKLEKSSCNELRKDLFKI